MALAQHQRTSGSARTAPRRRGPDPTGAPLALERARPSQRAAHGSAPERGSVHDWVARRAETARISLKRKPRFRLAPRGGQNGPRPGYVAILHGEWALGALEGRFWFPDGSGHIGGRAPAQGAHPSAVEALGVPNADLPGKWSLPTPPRPNPKARGRPVRAPSAIGESGWASRGDRASQICTRATGTRFRHFGGRHRISYSSIRCLRGACRHGPHGEVGGVPIPVLGWSRQPLYGSGRGRRPLQPAFQRGGTQPTPSGLYRGRARRGCLVGSGRGAAPLGVCSASLRERWEPREASAPVFLSPGTNNALPRAAFCRLWSPSCRPSARVRRATRRPPSR